MYPDRITVAELLNYAKWVREAFTELKAGKLSFDERTEVIDLGAEVSGPIVDRLSRAMSASEPLLKKNSDVAWLADLYDRS